MAYTVIVTDAGRYELGREEVGLKFEVNNDAGTLGRLAISKGGVRWTPRNA